MGFRICHAAPFSTIRRTICASPIRSLPPQETVSQCHSEECSDEESAFWSCSLGTLTLIRHEYGRKADPSLGLRMTRARVFELRHSLRRVKTNMGVLGILLN